MVDTLLQSHRKSTTTTLTVREDNILCDNEILSEAGVTENIAQTCAVHAAMVGNGRGENGGVKIGVIGAIRNLEILRLPQRGETLTTQIEEIQEVFNTTLVNATVSINNTIIATGEMKISMTETEVKGS
jgi:predicted hotdog family 3-hydroxylacyl-ACP dehydratase